MTRTPNVREQLVTAARDDLVEQGPGGVSLRAIARRVGVSHQASKHYFADRAALFSRVAADGLRELVGRCDAIFEGGNADDDPLDRIAALGAAYIDYADTNPAVFELMFGSGAGLVDPRAPELLQARASVWQRLLGAIDVAIEQGWGGGAPAEVLASMAWSTVHGLATLRREGVTLGTVNYEPEEILRAALNALRNSSPA